MNSFKILSGLISFLATFASIIISIISRLEYQQFLLWNSVDISIINCFINISLFFLIHIILGSIVFYLSFFQCIEIIKINNQAHEAKNRPKELLISGYYAKARHPMTARFFLIVLSFFFMIGSLIGIPLILLFALVFALLALYEEKKILFPIFGEKYEEYMQQVKNRFYGINTKILIAFLLMFMVIGVIFI